MPPEMSLTKPGSTAPVPALSAASPTRAAPFTVEKLPPTYTVVLVAASAVTRPPPNLGRNEASTSPVLQLKEAR